MDLVLRYELCAFPDFEGVRECKSVPSTSIVATNLSKSCTAMLGKHTQITETYIAAHMDRSTPFIIIYYTCDTLTTNHRNILLSMTFELVSYIT